MNPYPQGIPIHRDSRLVDLIREHRVDLVRSATPIDLADLVARDKLVSRVCYEYQDNRSPTLVEVIRAKLGVSFQS